MLTIGSLFSGIGGLELGLERAGLGPVLWQVEIEPYCRAVLAKHWPDARRYEDVRAVKWQEVEKVDVLCGGFPCVEISSCGKKGGLVGDSSLWYQMRESVRVLRPRFVVVENVGSLASRGLGTVLGDLSELGFDAEWGCVPACSLGAPFTRQRLFVVAHAHRHDEPVGSFHAKASWLREDAVHPWDGWESWCGVDGEDDGIPCRLDRLTALGNAVVPQVAEVVGWVVRGMMERQEAIT